MGVFKRVLRYANEYRDKHIISILLIFGSVIVQIIPYLLAYHILATFIEGDGGSLQYIIAMSVGIGVALWLKTLLLGKGLSASHEVAYDTLMGMRIAFAEKLIKLPMGKIQDKGTGSYKKNFVDDIEQVELVLAHMIPEGLPYVISPIVVFVVLLIVDWRLALLSLGSIPFGLIAMVIMMSTGMKKMEAYYRSEERMNKTIIEYIAGMEVIKIFNRTTSSFEKYSKNVKDYRDFTLDWFNDSWTYMAIYSAVLPCTILLLLPVGLHFYLSGTLELSTFLFSLMLTMSIGIPLVKLVEFLPTIPNLKFKINELEKIFEGDEVKAIDRRIKPADYTVTYSDVTFAYNEVNVIKNVSFKVNENTVTAIVGESGSGKSTLAKLLVKFWDVNSGKIEIGGVNICDMSMDRLMNLVSYVSQDTFLFDIPIMENIRIGRPDATDEEVIEAAKLAQCHEFISKLGKGYHTMPGDSGDKLSGGEKQRITIARAILKNSPIIILDEATSSTDSENEDKIQDALNSLIQDKTLIVIAHRLSTIVEADQILVMNEGILSDNGTHEQLLNTSLKYRQLWDAHNDAISWDIKVSNKLTEEGKYA
ncbi:MAG: ABC transporter ATP-binding protein/permease [Vallitalea sp.]|jgi:ATP-binding cassette subfamily B protein|nr:ABC transporter ATP-binding protein/permease [Vallitalea sp.]